MTDDIQTPARITEDHVQTRPALDEDMRPVLGRTAWSKLTPLEKCWLQDQLVGGNLKYTDLSRYQAGKKYAKLFRVTEGGSTDSTQALNVSRSPSMGANNDAQERAWDSRLAIESHMKEADRKIVQMVCGQEHTPAVAIKAACNDYKHTVNARFRESLDNLIDAMETAHRYPSRFNLARTG